MFVFFCYAGCVALQRSHQQGGRVSRVVRSPDERGQRRRPGMALQREDYRSDQESGSFSFLTSLINLCLKRQDKLY
jgi:hypothetical protein